MEPNNATGTYIIVGDSVMNPPNLTMTGMDAAYVLFCNITAILSIAACLVILSVYAAYKDIRTRSRLLLVYLSCADIVVNVSSLLQTATYHKSFQFPKQTSFLCQTAAGVMVYSQVSTALWTLALTFYLLLCLGGHCSKVSNRVMICFHVFCWLMPLVVSLSADFAGVYGYNITDILLYSHPVSCWIGGTVKSPRSWYFLTVEGWVIATYIIISLMHFAITWSVSCKKTKGKIITGDNIAEGIAEQAANEKLRFIPVIYVCTRIWGTGYFFFTHYPDSRHLRASDWLLLFKAIGDNSQGIVNAIFFCLTTQQIRQPLVTNLSRCCKCFSGWLSNHRTIGKNKWMKVQSIVRVRMPKKSRNLDGSDIDLSGISLDLPSPDGEFPEDDVIFER
ncbi:hypothetical protein BsWGS_02921 [Bradybaena similaris]